MTGISFSKSIEINAPVEKIWEALVNPEMIQQYLYGTQTRSTFKVGDPITFSGEYDGHQYLDKGEILVFEPYKMFSYTYLAEFSGLKDLPENYQIVTFTIAPASGGYQLTVEQRNIHSEEAKEHSEKGWGSVLQAIKKLIES